MGPRRRGGRRLVGVLVGLDEDASHADGDYRARQHRNEVRLPARGRALPARLGTLGLPAAVTLATTFAMSQGAKNWPFLTFRLYWSFSRSSGCASYSAGGGDFPGRRYVDHARDKSHAEIAL